MINTTIKCQIDDHVGIFCCWKNPASMVLFGSVRLLEKLTDVSTAQPLAWFTVNCNAPDWSKVRKESQNYWKISW